METKGKAVDSVIQYQLHRKTEGGESGDFECKFNGVKRINITVSEEITITSEYYDSLTDFEKNLLDLFGINVDDDIRWVYSDIKPNDFINYPFIDCYLVSSGVFEPKEVTSFIYIQDNYQILFNTDGESFFGVDQLVSDNINSNFVSCLDIGK